MHLTKIMIENKDLKCLNSFTPSNRQIIYFLLQILEMDRVIMVKLKSTNEICYQIIVGSRIIPRDGNFEYLN